MDGKWTMAWSYECPTVGGGGIFGIEINEPAGDQSTDMGPFQAGTSGSGTNNYNDIGTFSLGVLSTCTWSISITSVGSTPPATPSPTPTPAPTPAPTPSPAPGTGEHGYWLVGSDGGIFSFGSAHSTARPAP